jgi:cyclic pyranopterin phosphate synthase
MELSHTGEKGVRMVDISGKEPLKRVALASGSIRLRRETVRLIRENRIEKGNVLTTAQVAAIAAVKRTPDLIPLCHSLPLSGVEVSFDLREEEVTVLVEVKSLGRTGVEMEAITGASVALLTLWDMVKAVEKDAEGQYPTTEIRGIRVLEKKKGAGP